ncbi:MAG TPA: YraN family protein [Pyrinomonadaceae bacterium]|nr:YraN family protein [Pyrinomonadaceae bacterium]
MSKSSPELQTTLTRIHDLGRQGEALAAAYLDQLGLRIVAANFIVAVGRNRIGAVVQTEIDLIAYEGPILCFVEVKTRASDWFAPPSANVDLRKQRQVTRAARVYRRMFGLLEDPHRFDVVSVVLPPTEAQEFAKEADATNTFQIELLRNFWSEGKFRKRWPFEVHWD